MRHVLFVQAVRLQEDLVRARGVARDAAGLVGFDVQGQTRLATAVSEIARNALRYASGGDVELSVRLEPPQALRVRVVDAGPGIPHLDDVLKGRYRSTTGMGMGIAGTRRLVDEFAIETAPGRGTEVAFAQHLPGAAAPLTVADCARVERALLAAAASDPFEELQRQNRELLATLDELRRRQSELDRLNAELEDTNRGVMALYAELDDKAESLRRASEAKTSFLSNMTHEFRTPLNSVLSLAHMLLDRTDGDLTPEQERQVTYIRKSADDLSTLVNDLLDLAKVEAGKVDVRPSEFEASELFGGLKGALRPLLTSASVALHFDDPDGLPTLSTDEGKLSQILRNFVSNALKYTERGEIRVTAAYDEATDEAIFSVRDTGIGIAAEDHLLVFEEFRQIDSAAQRRTKGTGLGLPLSRRLAELLGGEVWLESELGVGSVFGVTIPARYVGPPPTSGSSPAFEPAPDAPAEAGRPRVLVVDDDEVSRYVVRDVLERLGCEVTEAPGGVDGLRAAREQRPDAIVLDLQMPDLGGEAVLAALKADPETERIPVVIYTSEALDADRLAALAAASAVVEKRAASRDAITTDMRAALEAAGLAFGAESKEVERG